MNASVRPLPVVSGDKPALVPSPLLTVVVPTFNERDNVRPIIARIENALGDISFRILFVDDNSPDKTAEAVRSASEETPFVDLLLRRNRRGLSGACIEGILTATTPFVAVIDGDMQHDEAVLSDMLNRLVSDDATDLVIGSRHVDGGAVGEGLSPIRRLGSDAFSWLTRKALGLDVTDPMSGFFMVRRASFIARATRLQPQGFKILADMLATNRKEWKVQEVGYQFRSREHGESKMDPAVTFELLALLISHMTGSALSIRFVLFCMVGLAGVAVQLAMVKLMLSGAGVGFAAAQITGIILAMTTNFIFNNLLTYRDRSLSGTAFVAGLLKFYVICSIGALFNLGIAVVVHADTQLWALASAAGAFLGAVWNFVISRIFTWKVR